jgi:hypothetical protein
MKIKITMDLLMQAIEIKNTQPKYGYKSQEIQRIKYNDPTPRKFAAVSYKDYKRIIKKKSITKRGYYRKWIPTHAQVTAIISTYFTDDNYQDQVKDQSNIKRLTL